MSSKVDEKVVKCSSGSCRIEGAMKRYARSVWLMCRRSDVRSLLRLAVIVGSVCGHIVRLRSNRLIWALMFMIIVRIVKVILAARGLSGLTLLFV